MSGVLPADLRVAAALGGETGQLLAAMDWAGHPLGDPSGWSPAARATVAVALASRFPIVLWFGAELRLVYNDAYIPMLGDKHPAAFGRAAAEVWWDIWDVIAPMLDGVMSTGKATWSDDLMLMLVNQGRRQERFFTFTYSPILGGTGKAEGVFCAVAETTERVLGERRLQALNALAAALLDVQSADEVLRALIDVCAVHDADLPFTAVYLTDGTPGQARAHLVTEAAAGLLPGALAPLLPAASTGSEPWLADGLPRLLPGLKERFGDLCPEQALVIPVSEPVGQEPGAVLVLGLNCCRPLDAQYRGFCRLLADQVSAAITAARAYEDERRRAEALAELDRAKSAFLANVSHEFRTPLTLLLGPLEDELASAGTSAAGRERLEMARRNGQRLLRLVNSLLDFSRIEAGKAALQPAVLDVGALTAGVASSFADVCRLAGIALVTDCRPAWVEVDPGMWETIVLNLVSNAVKHTTAGTITVRIGPDDHGGVTLTVTDTGCGIPAADLPRLFDRFYRAASTPGRSAEGSGIGLALVKSQAEMHGGTVAIDSTPGAGTTVTVRLPRDRVRAPAADGPASEPTARAAAFTDEALQWVADEDRLAGTMRTGTVLVVDDNADMRAHLRRVLGGRFDVITAVDGRQALRLAREQRPGVLVTDVMMPGLDGLGLVAAIRADPELAALPVIVLSARAGIEAAGEGLDAGADDYVVKPFSSADLIRRVAARLDAAGRDLSRAQDGEAAGMARLGAALATARTLEDVLDAVLGTPECSLGASSAAIAMLDDERGQQLRVTFRGGIRAETADRYHRLSLDAPLPLAEAARTGQPVIVPDTADLPGRFPVAADPVPDAGASIIHPLHAADGPVIGSFSLSWSQPREFSRQDGDITGRVAGMLSRAAARITIAQRQQQIAMALQERLLHPGPGTRAAVTAAVYESAGEALRVGGDWYTVTPLGGQRTGISAGDVAGHGLEAAAVMSQLRSALATAALADGDPAGVLNLVDRYARGLPGAAFATAAYAVIDSGDGTVRYTCAGHPYPLVVAEDGTPRYLTGSRRSPLAASPAALDVPAACAPLPAGSLLVMFTDGLVERRGESLEAGFGRLAEAAVGCARLPVGEVCARLLERLAPSGGYADDVAVVAARPVGTTAASHVEALPASFTEMAAARARLRGWLEAGGAAADQADRVLFGAGEAIANAIEHGSGQDPDRVIGIEAFADGDAVTVTVTDTGRWIKDSAASRSAGRGLGLTVMHGLADSVQTSRGPFGTRITSTWRIPASAQLTGGSRE